MAVDGSIRLKAQLDTTGFKAGSQQMQSALSGLNGTVKNVGAQMGQALQGAGQSAQTLGSQLQTVFSSGDLGKAMSDITRDANTLTGQLTRLGERAQLGIGSESQLDRYELGLEKASDNANILRAKLAEVGGATFYTSDYDRLSQQLDSAYVKAEALETRMADMQALGVDEQSKGYQRLDMQLLMVQDDIAFLHEEMQKMEDSGTAFVTGDQTEQYQQMIQRLQVYEAEMQRLLGLGQDYGDSLAQQAAQKEQNAAASAAQREAARAEAEAQRAEDADMAARQKAKAEAMKKLQAAALGAAKAVASITGKGLLSLGSAVASTLNPFKRIITHAKKASSATAGLVKALTGFKRMLLSRIKRTFISSIFKELQAGIHNMAKHSASFNAAMSGMKNSMSGLAGNIGVAAANIIGLFAPAITAIIDLISKAITYVNAFFALMSGKSTYTVAAKGTNDYAKSLQGAGGAAKDLNRQVYGFDQLNKESGGGGGGGGSSGGSTLSEQTFDSLPESIRSFMESIKTAFSAGQFERVGEIVASGFNSIIPVVDNWITGTLQPMAITWSVNIARILNGMVSGVNWHGLGGLLGDGLNTIFYTANAFVSTFNWQALGQGIANGVNGAINSIDWVALGIFMASKANIIWGSLYGFVSTLHWDELGTSVSEGFSAMFTAIPWDTIALTIGTGVNGIVLALTNFITTTDWPGMASQLASSVNLLAETIDWPAIGALVSTGAIEILNAISEFITTTDWEALGTDLAEMLGGIDWSGVMTALSNAIGAAVGGLGALVWGLIGAEWDKCVDFWKTSIESAGGDIVQGLLNGILTGITGIATWIQTNMVDPFVNGFKSAMGINSPSTVFEGFGGYIVEGLLNGVKSAFNGIKTWIDTNMYQPFISGFKSLFGINSPSTVMAGMGGYLVEGVKKGINGGWTSFNSWVEGKFSGLISSIKRTLGIHSPSTVMAGIGDFMMQGLTEGLDAGADAATQTMADIAADIQSEAEGAAGEATLRVNVADTIDAAAEKLSAVAGIFAAIAESIQQMGGLAIPTVATGGVIPYKARVDGGPVPSGAIGDLSGFVDNFDATMYDHRDILQEILTAIRGLDLTVDGDSLTKAVTARQRANNRVFGGA